MWVFPKKKKHRGNDRISSRLSRAYWPSYHYYTAARCPACVVCHPLPSTDVDPLNSLWPLLDLNGSYMKRETYSCCYSSVTTWVVGYYKDLKVVFVLKIGQISGLEQWSKSLEKVQYGWKNLWPLEIKGCEVKVLVLLTLTLLLLGYFITESHLGFRSHDEDELKGIMMLQNQEGWLGV